MARKRVMRGGSRKRITVSLTQAEYSRLKKDAKKFDVTVPRLVASRALGENDYQWEIE